jgi:hypothetical protein
MYSCDTISGGKCCSIAHKSDYNECFKCQSVVSLSSGRFTAILIRSLYTWFVTKRYDEYYLCIFDYTKYYIPQKLYINPENSKIKFPRGTLVAPFVSISDAMSSIRSEKASILRV